MYRSYQVEWNDLYDLEELDLSWNKNLETFSCTGLTKLKKLYFRWCNIEQLPAEWNALHDLEELDLSWNENLQPFSCTGLTKLKKLNLRGCKIIHEQLPAEGLKMLNLSGCQQLPDLE